MLVLYQLKHLGLEREFKEIGHNLRKFGSSKKEFNFKLWKHWDRFWAENNDSQVNMLNASNAVVTPLRKAASYEPRIAILGIWGDAWLTRGKYGIYVAVRGSYGALTGSTWRLLEILPRNVKSSLSTVMSPTWR